MKKRLLSLLLALAMVLGMFPFSAFALEDVPFTATVDGEELTDIQEAVFPFLDWSFNPYEQAGYIVTIPGAATEVTLEFEEEKNWTFYDFQGGYIGEGATSWENSASHTIPVQDFNGDGELDGVSVQAAGGYETEYYILFVYGAQEDIPSCIQVAESAPADAVVSAGGLYELLLETVFTDSDEHSICCDYTIEPAVENEHTKIADGKFYFTCKEMGDYTITLTAECDDGKTAQHTLNVTVKEANQGIDAQYGYEETDKSSVTVYVTLSSDGMPLVGEEGTVLANLEVTVPYFELSLYGMQEYNRYGTDGGKGPYVNNTVIKRPTGLHLYIYLLERYYMGLDESQCCIGASNVREFMANRDVLYMTGETAYATAGNQALRYSGGATSFFMNQFWGHDCNLMYYRNHCYPYMTPGWGSTADYILLSDGDAIDLAMFTNWGFYHDGYFASFDQDVYEVAQGGGELTVSTRQWGTSAAAESFVNVNGSEGLSVVLYDIDWNELDTFAYDSSSSNTITVQVPEEDGIYYLLAMDPNAADSEKAKVAPAVARIVVGTQDSDSTVDVSEYYADYDFISIKDDQGNYLVDITPGMAYDEYGMYEVPTHQITVKEGTETVYVTFDSDSAFAENIALYDVESGVAVYDMEMLTLNIVNNDDGTVTVEIPTESYTETGTGVILEDSNYNWIYGFDFVVGEITEITVGTSVSRILLNSYAESKWIGETVQLVASVMPAEATGWEIVWSSSDESIATVDQNGLVTAVGDGTAIITAAIGDVKAQCSFTSQSYNSAPSVVSGTPSWNKLTAGEKTILDVSGWFTDAEQTELTYTAEIKKATAANFTQSYDYSTVSGPQVSVNGYNVFVTVPDIGIYMLYVTASDGKLTKTHQCQLTVVNNDSGVFQLNDGVTVSVYNVVPVGYSRDGNTHYVIVSKDTLRRQGATTIIKWSVTKEDGYSYSGSTSFGIGGSLTATVKDPDGNSTQHTFKCLTECSGEHTDADDNGVCDKCKMKVEKPGQFALLAVSGNGYAIEPTYVSYEAGATVKEALKASGYTFNGIDSGFITSIEGTTDPFVLHYDGDGYDLNAPASKVTALWFTTNISQPYSQDMLNLTAQIALFNTATNGVKDYAVAQAAYQKAADDFILTGDANSLYTNLKNAMDAYNNFGALNPVPVTMDIVIAEEDGKNAQKLETGLAVFTSEFNTVHSFQNFSEVKLAPANYSFDISDGTFRHVRGEITVTESGTVLIATVPAGTWIQDMYISMESGTDPENSLERGNVTESSATFYVPSSQGWRIYPNAVRVGEDIGYHKLYFVGYDYALTWNSKQSVVIADYHGIHQNSLEGAVGVFEARREDGSAYQQYQTFTATFVRTPDLTELDICSKGTKLNTTFDPLVKEYAVTSTSDTVDIVTKTLSGVTVSVNGVTGNNVSVALSDSIRNDDGTYTIRVTTSAPGCRDNVYTITVTKVAPVTSLLSSVASNMDIQVFNPAGGLIVPVSITPDGETSVYAYELIEGVTYQVITTINTYYHASQEFQAGDNLSVPVPITDDWSTGIAARTGSNAASELTPDSAFEASDHEYTFTLDSVTSALRIKANCSSFKTYTVNIYYKSHNNDLYSAIGDPDMAAKDMSAEVTSSSYKQLNRAMKNGGYGNEFRIEYKKTANGVTYYQEYYVYVTRDMVLNSLTAADAKGDPLVLTKTATGKEGFSKLIMEYNTLIASGADQINLILNHMSTNNYDYGSTITISNGQWSQTIVFEKGSIEPDGTQTVTVPLSGTTETENITITVSHSDPTATDGVYTLAVEKLPPVDTTFVTDPADAVIFLTDNATGVRILPNEDGTFTLNTQATYSYVITRNGYVAQNGTFVAGEDTKTISVSLTATTAEKLPDISMDGDWLQFRADNNNNGVVNTKTPIKAEDAVLEWANKIGDGYDSGATGCPIIVGGYLYTYAGNAIHKVNKETGETVKSGEMVMSSSFAINSPTYAEGMIFVGLSGGRVQAFDADSLESLWVYEDKLGGQPNCPIVYHDGYIYTGFWNAERRSANFVCLSVADENPNELTEAKQATWTYTHNGFYWAGAYVCKDFVLIGTDDGEEGYITGTASILSLDPKTGLLLDEEKLTNVGDQRSSICYDPATDAYYFTTKGGDLYQVKVNADGTFKDYSLRRLHLNNGGDSAENPPMSTSTPVIYNGRAYIGVSGTSQFGNYSGHNISVIDLNSFSIAYTVPTMGYPQTSGLLTTAYEETDGYVYVYFIDNATPGMIRVLRDRPGMTEVDPAYVGADGLGYVLFTPDGDEAQYAICSPISDSEGNLYFKNDSARMMRLSSRITSLEIVSQPDKLSYKVNETFDAIGMQVIAHYANGNQKDITNYLSYTTDPLTTDDTEITVSFAPDKMFEKDTTPEGGYWQWYQDVDGKAGQTYYLPRATVSVEITKEYIAQWNVTLKDNIGVNFYVELTEEDAANAKMQFTVNGETTIVNAADALVDGKYVFTADLAAAQMMDTVLAELVVNGETVEADEYSIRMYADYILDESNGFDAQTKALVMEMLNYGAKAQLYFNHNTETLATDGLDLTGINTAEIPEAVDTEISAIGNISGIRFYGSSLLFQSRTAVRFYFTGDISRYEIAAEGMKTTVGQKDGMWYVEVNDILPQDLEDSITLTVISGEDTLTVIYGPMNYMVRMNQKGSDSLKALLKAMYNYHLAAEAYTSK